MDPIQQSLADLQEKVTEVRVEQGRFAERLDNFGEKVDGFDRKLDELNKHLVGESRKTNAWVRKLLVVLLTAAVTGGGLFGAARAMSVVQDPVPQIESKP